MPKTHHTWLFEPGRWTATGRFLEGGEVEREMRGVSIVRHEGTTWEIEGEMEVLGEAPARFRNRYRVDPPGGDAAVVPWRSENPAVGPLTGVFTVVGDGIVSLFRSEDGTLAGSECLARLAPDRYRGWGVLTASGQVVSTWSTELVREG